MLHGLVTGNLASWYFTCAPTLARSHRVVLYDLRGHGASDRPRSGYTLDHHLGDLTAVSANLEPFALVGHSFGALVALRAALRVPHRITRLVLVEPPLDPPEGNVPWNPRALLSHPDGTPIPLAATARDRIHDTLDNTTLVADVRASARISDDDLAALARSGLPVTVVFGEDSPFSGAATRVVAALGPATTHVLPGGHALHLDATEALRRLLTEALADNTAPLDPQSDPGAPPTPVTPTTGEPVDG